MEAWCKRTFADAVKSIFFGISFLLIGALIAGIVDYAMRMR